MANAIHGSDIVLIPSALAGSMTIKLYPGDLLRRMSTRPSGVLIEPPFGGPNSTFVPAIAVPSATSVGQPADVFSLGMLCPVVARLRLLRPNNTWRFLEMMVNIVAWLRSNEIN